LKLKYSSNPHSHGIITCSNTTDPDLGGRPPRSKILKWIFGESHPRSEKLKFQKKKTRVPNKQNHKEILY